MSKATELRTKTADELTTMLLDLRKEQFNLRLQRATGQQEEIRAGPHRAPRDRAGEDRA